MPAALAQLDRVLSFFPRVEGKASFLFAINLSLIATAFAAVSWKSFQTQLFVGLLLTLVLLLCTASLIFLYFAYAPHLSAAKKKSLLYFRDIANHEPEEFVTQWTELQDKQLLEDALHQVWRNCEILSKKFSATEGAFTLTAFAVIPWLVLLVTAVLERQSFQFGS
ncbi:MAG TPA: Pycsar system effector family protein [Vitreimonas sp.]|uniref:Pycsar system effector family protein n=1 Tax=Vitreimonas sp. TaxID=3069702 RepID=UPI002D2D7E21|nr:Pycsar system effector family protein [Vitreimonas sp.]HYD88644.1 Pycsar system effector family protein [Vitreimonas sp.]